MAFSRLMVASLASVLLTGCGYVHFGRAPHLRTDASSARLATAYSDLATEQKMLRQELALARKESDTLRAALERAGGTPATGADARTASLLQELTELRASHARLESERTAVANLTRPAETGEKINELEQKLATADRARETLQAEVAQLRQDLDRVRAENIALNSDLQRAHQRQEETRALLAAREADLENVAAARQKAEQLAEAARGQLQEALRNPPPAMASSVNPSAAPRTAASSSPLQMAKSPPAGAVTREVRGPYQTNDVMGPAQPATATGKTRVHTVQRGDTLEKLSRTYYGAPDQWHRIYEANLAELSTGRPLQPGMELTIPDPAP